MSLTSDFVAFSSGVTKILLLRLDGSRRRRRGRGGGRGEGVRRQATLIGGRAAALNEADDIVVDS